ncbi:hypothetical protein [Azospirillum sp. sgz301742]
MTDNRDKKQQNKTSGGSSALGDQQKFKKDEAHDAKKDEQAKDEIGRMGEASEQNKRAKDVR